MYCIGCGTRLPDDASFCSSCGRATHRADPAESIPVSEGPLAAATDSSLGESGPRSTARTWSEAFDLPYLHEGRWWARGPSGEVLVWQEQKANWDLALSTQTPFFMRRPRFRSPRTPAIWIYVFTACFLLCTVLSFASGVDQAVLADDLRNSREVSANEISDADDIWAAMRGLQAFALLGLGAMALWWIHRLTRNLPSLGAVEQKYSPRSALYWWVIPIANWFMPYKVFSQAWRASDSSLPLRENTEWRDKPGSDFALCAWVAIQVANVGWSIVLNGWGDSDSFTADERWGWALGSMASDVGLVLAATMGIIVVARMTRRQDAANARFDPRAAAPATAIPAVAEPSL